LSVFEMPDSLEIKEPSAEEVLGRELLLAPPILLGQEWKSSESAEEILACLKKCQEHNFDFDSAFCNRVEMQDLDGAEKMLRIFRSGIDDEKLSKLQGTIHSEKEANSDLLHLKIGEIRSNNEIAFAYGLVSEAERAAVESRLVMYELVAKDTLAFTQIFRGLNEIVDVAKSQRLARTSELRSRFEALKRLEVSAQTLEILNKSIESGDILTANEQFQRAERLEPLESLSQDAIDQFGLFFPTQVNAIENAMRGEQPDELLRLVQTRSSIGPLDFSVLGTEQDPFAGTYAMLKAWFSLKTEKNHPRDSIRLILQGIGFGTSQSAPQKTAGLRNEWDVTTEPISDRNICQVPHFGSRAAGLYRIVLVAQKQEEDIVRLASAGVHSRPTIVLFFGRLNERKRREISREAKASQHSFLIVDEILIFKLAAEPRSRLALFFSLTLPFSYSAPFDPTSSVVPTEMFFGRAAELKAVQDIAGHCFIYGGRQLGKTALLRKAEQLFHHPESGQGHYAKWIDLKGEGIGTTLPVGGIWGCLARAFSEIGLMPMKSAARAEPSSSMASRRIDSFIAELKGLFSSKPALRVLLLLDEADKFFELDAKDEFAHTSRLKGIMESTDRRFKVVFAGLHNVLRTSRLANNPLAHFGEPIPVGPLLEGAEWYQAQDLITKPFSAAGFVFEEPSLVTRILAQTNYYPSLIQLYCSHLLRHMVTAVGTEAKLDGPSYVIRSQHIDASYKGRQRRLSDEIRAKFQLTLQLDTRYEVIAYSLAYEMLNAAHKYESLNYKRIRVLATQWWPKGFLETDEHDFKVLLSEMVSLGVLREVVDGNFHLRNPNIILLLGGSEEIETLLLMDREPPPELEYATFRKRLGGRTDLRGCFTAQDIDRIGQAINRVSIVVGSVATAIDDIERSLEGSFGQEFLETLSGSQERHDFSKALRALTNRPVDGTKILIVPYSTNWNAEWVSEAVSRLEKLNAKDRFAHVLFVADPKRLWNFIEETPESLMAENSIITLRHWSDGFVRHWLEDCNLSHKPEFLTQVSEATGMWPVLLYRLTHRNSTELIEERLAKVHADLKTTPKYNEILGLFGVMLPVARKCLSTLAALGDGTDEQDIAELSEVERTSVSHVMIWAEYLGYVTRVGTSSFTLNPWLAKALLMSPQEI